MTSVINRRALLQGVAVSPLAAVAACAGPATPRPASDGRYVKPIAGYAPAPIAFEPRMTALAFQTAFPALQALFYASPKLQFATRQVQRRKVEIPTRHGIIHALVYAPATGAPRYGGRPPVHLVAHGGAFIVRMPSQEDNVARYLASEVGCYVILPDYQAAPQIQFPVSELQMFDAYRWIRDTAEKQGWDGARITVGGSSAGASLAMSIVQQALDAGEPLPLAASYEFGTCDMARPDAARTSPIKSPVVSPTLMRLVRNTYFNGLDLTDPFVSPLYDGRLGRFPPALILTAAHDTLRHEMKDFGAKMLRLGGTVTMHEFADVDHGFTHTKPVAVAREAIVMMGDHLASAYRRNSLYVTET